MELSLFHKKKSFDLAIGIKRMSTFIIAFRRSVLRKFSSN